MRTEPPVGEELNELLASIKTRVLAEAAQPAASVGRTPLSDRLVAFLVALAVLLGIGAAGAAIALTIGSASPEPTAPAAGASPTPSSPPLQPEVTAVPATTVPAAPTPELSDTSTITVRPEALELSDDAGTLITTVSYNDPIEHIVEVLTAALGAPPVVEDHSGLATSYGWPGLRVSDDLRTGPGHLPMNVAVSFTAPLVGDGVTVTTVVGFRPGDDLEAYAASVGERWWPDGQNLIPLEYGPELGPSPIPGRLHAYAVAVEFWAVPDAEGAAVFAPFDFGREQGAG